jgi:hypothetical protein
MWGENTNTTYILPGTHESLGCNFDYMLDRIVESTLFMGDNIAFAVRPHITLLPKDCHFIAGLDWMVVRI